MLNQVFSNNLKRFRQQKNLTQEQVAEALGVNTHTVSRWECSTTLPDVTMLPELARLYCVTVDDFFKRNASAYENYARRLASIFDMTREPEDFIRAEQEFKRLLKTGDYSTEDLRLYGILHQHMAKYCARKAESLFDRILQRGMQDGETVYWRTRHQKMLLLSQQGRVQENIDAANAERKTHPDVPENWICLIAAYQYAGQWQQAYKWFCKAVEKFPAQDNLYIFGGDICKELGYFEDAMNYWDRALQSDANFYDASYAKAFYFEEIGDYEQAHTLWCRIAQRLRQDGYDIEAAAEEKRAEACLDKLGK